MEISAGPDSNTKYRLRYVPWWELRVTWTIVSNINKLEYIVNVMWYSDHAPYISSIIDYKLPLSTCCSGQADGVYQQ